MLPTKTQALGYVLHYHCRSDWQMQWTLIWLNANCRMCQAKTGQQIFPETKMCRLRLWTLVDGRERVSGEKKGINKMTNLLSWVFPARTENGKTEPWNQKGTVFQVPPAKVWKGMLELSCWLWMRIAWDAERTTSKSLVQHLLGQFPWSPLQGQLVTVQSALFISCLEGANLE